MPHCLHCCDFVFGISIDKYKLFLPFKCYLLLFCMYGCFACIHVCEYTTCIQDLWRPGDGIRSPWIWFLESGELPCGCWDTNPLRTASTLRLQGAQPTWTSLCRRERESAERLYHPETVDDYNQVEFSKHNRVAACLNSRHKTCRSSIIQTSIPVGRGEVDMKTHS